MNIILGRQIIDLLLSMIKIHSEIEHTEDANKKINLLADCQDAAYAISDAIENDDVIMKLADYIEKLFHLSQKDKVATDEIHSINVLIESLIELVTGLLSKKTFVFFPYSASMWDSLESIWYECNEDENCECLVIPIPYFKFDVKKESWEMCYEGNSFPDYVKVLNYQDINLEKLGIDVAYIHNPYDNANTVTSIHPDFYSDKLKSIVKKLIYVPYYVTSGFINPNHLNLPVYNNMDYMIAQGENVKQAFKDSKYYDKVVAFGSPKLDKIINTKREDVNIPISWRPILKDKKVLMLNSSIGCLLYEGDSYLDKLMYIGKVISEKNNLALIWRPHPLLQATIKSMRPDFDLKLEKIIETFSSISNIIIDRTHDISNAIISSDGYIGEESSSVINLFACAGKPVFILNNLIRQEYKMDNRKRLHVIDMVTEKDEAWFTSRNINGVFHMDLKSKEIEFLGRNENEVRWLTAYSYLCKHKNDIYLSPSYARAPSKYSLNQKEFVQLLGSREQHLRLGRIIYCNEKVFYLPESANAIVEYNIDANKWITHKECLDTILNTGQIKTSVAWDYAHHDDSIWITFNHTNQILEFNTTNGEYELHKINHGTGYSGIVYGENELWLAEVISGDLVKWDFDSKKFKVYEMPSEFKVWENRDGVSLAHMRLFDMGEYIVTTPGFSNSMTKLCKENGKVSLLIKDYWSEKVVKMPEYDMTTVQTSLLASKIDETKIMVQRTVDASIAIINILDETFESFYPELNQDSFESIISDDDGFERVNRDRCFVRRESKYFTFEELISELLQGKFDDFGKVYSSELFTMASNIDGTCGKKTHEFVMKNINV